MAFHTLEPDARNLHGYFSVELPPILTIEPGDTVRLRTLDAGWGLEPPFLDRSRKRRKVAPPPEAPMTGHALCGPIAMRGAEPGMTLEVRLEVLHPGPWGWTWVGGWPGELNERLGVAEGDEELLLWSLNVEQRVGHTQHGHTVALRPFLGILGMPPPEAGPHPTWPPRVWGGNMDCKELVAGSTLFLPIPVAEALFSVGDGHAAQGDGEVCGQAIECPMECVELTLALRPDLLLSTPRAHTPTGWITFGFHEDLNEATFLAIQAMLDLMQGHYGLSALVTG